MPLMDSPPLIRTFSYHYRRKYHVPVGKIPLHSGSICPNRKKGGCIYCSPTSFAPGYLRDGLEISRQIEAGKKYLLRSRFKKYFGYFQQETCTSGPVKLVLSQFRQVVRDDDCLGLIISTRPDYISENLMGETAELVAQFGKECLVELGVQSVHQKSLLFLNRNHSFADFLKGLRTLKKFPELQAGAHVLLGIPGESQEEMLQTIEVLGELGVNALKLHHLQVIADTQLAKLYAQKKVRTFRFDEYLELLLLLLPLVPMDVVIHRLWATSHPDQLIAPKWNVLATHLSNRLRSAMQTRGVYQGQHRPS